MDRTEELERELRALSWTVRGFLAALILIMGMICVGILLKIVPKVQEILMDLLEGHGQLPVLTQLLMQFSFPLACFVGLIALGSFVALFAAPRPGAWPVILGALVLVGLVLVTILAVVVCFIPMLSLIREMSSHP